MRSTSMMASCVALLALAASTAIGAPADDYAREIAAWRKNADERLRRDLGWLTIAGRFELKQGANTLGSARDNDVVLPKELAPARLGTLHVDKANVRLALARGVRMWTEPAPGERGAEFTERVLATRADDNDWVTSGRLSFYVFTRGDGLSVLRIADRESRHRKAFGGRIWYDVDQAMRRPARFVAYPPGTRIPIANVRGEISEEDAAGRVEFDVGGRTHSLDAFAEEDGTLFLILRDATSGSTTYPAGRFLVAPKPVDGATVLDFNRAYNPPCAFSAYTTCPLPPPQNWLAAPIEAGERYAQK
jgi:uncharacterized protein (DUF1684 family)